MLNNYSRSAHQLAQLLYQQGIRSQKVLDAIASTPRHIFVDDVLKHKSYQNTALPIGLGQTISQPFIVARMTELLLQLTSPSATILEIGTGSGYQSAILAQCFERIYSVERIKALQWQAKRRLQQLDLFNVVMKHGDGWQGWQANAPYDGIIVTAAASEIPQALVEQLNDGGVLISPIGEHQQHLVAVKRQGKSFITQTLEEVRFVPLVAGAID
ncbi:protein-L-isoaspartate(D-aspartate) O-methyltransferase [Pseudoalteromonas sp. G4]|uniref:protein-L-isoaspartate(D-aspartate) O-methyltransferase n=1 Tax=Pseudoalteromonas sp. G4 TaxID=2992761 RepID=UPI00237E0FD2|nr:protein-L-isoaspartate(D-aspartate) O-methyltransferase [Pseudoalteromonas sp. G4]MDE3272794.1 protein-L-isoaspartate(D-aspartate) O-methyltransferase [Pseudoalteromonas sp. G4]